MLHCMKKFGLLIFLVFTLLQALAQTSAIEATINASDVIISGKVIDCSAAMIDDLGTNNYIVTLDVDSIYLRNTFVQQQHIQLFWKVNGYENETAAFQKKIQMYKQGKWVFFINRIQLYSSAQMNEDQIQVLTPEIEAKINAIKQTNLIRINNYAQNKTCPESCKFCKAISQERWHRVKRYFKHKTIYPLTAHRNVKWALPDHDIILTLPSFMTIRYMFNTSNGQVPAYARYQVGYYHSFASWIPWTLHKLFHIQAYRYFHFENTNKLILRKFNVKQDAATSYISAYQQSIARMLTDSSLIKVYGPNMPIPAELVLLHLVSESEFRFYLDYQSMPDYAQRAYQYIDDLKNKDQIYTLCLMAFHTNPDFGRYALKALADIRAINTIPFLIQIAEQGRPAYANSDLSIDAHEHYWQQLSRTLDELTGCYTYAHHVPFGVSGNLTAIAFSLPVWKSKYVVLN